MMKRIIWTAVSVLGTAASAIAGLVLYEDKRKENERQVNAAVDKRIMELVEAKQANGEER